VEFYARGCIPERSTAAQEERDNQACPEPAKATTWRTTAATISRRRQDAGGTGSGVHSFWAISSTGRGTQPDHDDRAQVMLTCFKTEDEAPDQLGRHATAALQRWLKVCAILVSCPSIDTGSEARASRSRPTSSAKSRSMSAEIGPRSGLGLDCGGVTDQGRRSASGSSPRSVRAMLLGMR